MDTFFETVLGGDPGTLHVWQVALRTLLIYLGGVLLVRLGKRRFMGSYSAFDMILGVTVGALLSAAADPLPKFLAALGVVFGLVLLHWISSWVAYRWDRPEQWLKGKERALVNDGKVDWNHMKHAGVSKADLAQALRHAGVDDLQTVERACFERNGEISVQTKGSELFEIAVEPGVQRVVIEVRR